MQIKYISLKIHLRPVLLADANFFEIFDLKFCVFLVHICMLNIRTKQLLKISYSVMSPLVDATSIGMSANKNLFSKVKVEFLCALLAIFFFYINCRS